MTIAISLCGVAFAQERRDFVFSSEELGFPEIDTTITFAGESQRTFRVRYSKPPAYPDLLMLYTMLHFCAARKIALEEGFDRSGLAPDFAETGVVFFLKPGEAAAEVFDPRFANRPTLSVADPTIAEGCDQRASHAFEQAQPPAAVSPPSGVTHVEDCTEWRYRDDRFAAVNNCKDPSAIQFMLTCDQRVIEGVVKPGEFFDTGLSRNQMTACGSWLFTACPAGSVPSVPFSLAHQNEIRASRYGCSRK